MSGKMGEVFMKKTKVRWNHSFPAFKIKGQQPIDVQRFVATLIPTDLTGKTVLDLGAWDGYFSFLCAQYNADVVVALDSMQGEIKDFKGGPRTLYTKYNAVAYQSKLNVHFIPMDALDIDKIKMNFDIILCFGLYYHVSDPVGLFQKCYDKCNEMLLVEGFVTDSEETTIYLYDEKELKNDPTNYWGFTTNALIKMLKRIGFKKVTIVDMSLPLKIGEKRVLLKCVK